MELSSKLDKYFTFHAFLELIWISPKSNKDIGAFLILSIPRKFPFTLKEVSTKALFYQMYKTRPGNKVLYPFVS